MLVPCRLADLSALEAYYAEVKLGAQCGVRIGPFAACWPDHAGKQLGASGFQSG
jgi:hypothetical protein